ncbi:MAG: SLBB domain-containing protein [Kiritimatiellae bacterium]|jgi:[NiFe] hydrogenase diaphorase moiety large subunit|nr:SLBB domain-containing protein [Kiritimatiellia bacterium]
MITSTCRNLTFETIEPWAGLKRAMELGQAGIIREVTDSGIKGRGGAGFPAGVKWNLCAAAKDPLKYIICNADEGEPGTFKDRVILTDFADLVFEGMIIAAMAIKATEGILYLRGEYTYLREGLEAQLLALRVNKKLGENACGVKGFDFNIKIRMGSGAYVCGEETALIESLEGHRGEPRNRPPYPVNTGFNGHSTAVNNVESLAWISCILSKGSKWFSQHGTEKSTGLKLFSVSGDCDKPGVYELPLGITVAELLVEVGGSNAKAVQIGGASGRCVPAIEFDRKIAYEDIPTGGSVIVFGPGRDMLDVAQNFLEFMVEESCGQCTPCRYGNPTLLEGVQMLREGRCSAGYLKELVSLGETIQIASKCGLGQSSANAFLSIVKHFKEEIMGRAIGDA